MYNIEAKTTALPSTDFLLHWICHSLFVAPENLDLIHSVESGGLSHSSTNSNTPVCHHFIQIWYPPNSTTQVQNSDSKKLVWKSRFKWVVKFGTHNYEFIGDLLFFSQITGKYKRILWETHNYISIDIWLFTSCLLQRGPNLWVSISVVWCTKVSESESFTCESVD